MRLDQVEQRRGFGSAKRAIVSISAAATGFAAASPARSPLMHIAPPLQADLARHRLARAVAHARDLGIEGIEREQRPALVGRREQRREEAILVGRADQRLAMTIVRVHRAQGSGARAQSTAISAAPTRRRSPNRML